MLKLETVGIRVLKNNLSAYIKKAAQGVRVLVSDRGRIVVEMRTPGSEVQAFGAHPLMAEWMARGVVRGGSRSAFKAEKTGVLLPLGTARRLLDEERGN